MRRSAPLRGLLTGLVALVVFASAAVALATSSSTPPPPPRQLPVATAAVPQATTADRTQAETVDQTQAGAQAQTFAAAGDGGRRDGDRRVNGRGFGGGER